MIHRLASSVMTSCALLAFTPGTADAYTDPGSGVMLWQLVTGAVVAGGFYFRKVIALFLRRGRRDQ